MNRLFYDRQWITTWNISYLILDLLHISPRAMNMHWPRVCFRLILGFPSIYPHRQLPRPEGHGLRLRKKSGHDGHIDWYPCCNIASGNCVSWARETTANTTKLVSGRTVRPGDMMTNRAFLRSISRVDAYHTNAGHDCFVVDKLPELTETLQFWLWESASW